MGDYMKDFQMSTSFGILTHVHYNSDMPAKQLGEV